MRSVLLSAAALISSLTAAGASTPADPAKAANPIACDNLAEIALPGVTVVSAVEAPPAEGLPAAYVAKGEADLRADNKEIPASWSRDRTRKLRPWPKISRYDGGDIEKAESFSCR
jgi:hypothetical protein